jgi:3D (Asp-Asp-Asp) domain-containing protein
MTKSLFGGSAAVATALLTMTTFFYAPPLAAEPAHTGTQEPVQQQEQTLAQEQKVVPVPPAPLAEISLLPSEIIAPPVPSATVPVPAVADVVPVMPPPTAPKAATKVVEESPAASQQAYVATAYCLSGRTASGRPVSKGLIAADPRVLPMGTRVRLDAGPYSGEYTVADVGGAVKGRKIDVWVPSGSEARRFGRRQVKLTVLSYGTRRRAKGSK